MKVDDCVYITELLKPCKDRVIHCICQGKAIPKIYCIVNPIGKVGLFEIYSYAELRGEYYKDKSITVVGIASSEQDAKILLCRMISDMYESGQLKIRETSFMKE
ncbi:MAG: hypothetical protein ACOX1S_05885 [Anaerostipes sp.]|jgi:hypothetical protein